MNTFSRPIHFGLAYSILQTFNRRELYKLSLISRYFSAIIDQKLGNRPYLLLSELQRENGKWIIRKTSTGSYTPTSESDKNYEMLQACKYVRFDNVNFDFRPYDHPSSMHSLFPICHVWEDANFDAMWYHKITPPDEFFVLVTSSRELFLNGLGIIPHLRTLLLGFTYSIAISDQRRTKGYAMQSIPVTEIVDFFTKPGNGTDPVDLYVSATFLPSLEQRSEIVERLKEKFEAATSKLLIVLTWTTVNFLPEEVGEIVRNRKTKMRLEITNNDDGLYIKTYNL